MLYVVVALYYYFRIVVSMFMEKPTDSEELSWSPGISVALAVTIAMTLFIGIYPEPFIVAAGGAVLPLPR